MHTILLHNSAVDFCVLEKLSTCIPLSAMIPDDVDFLLAFSGVFRLAESLSESGFHDMSGFLSNFFIFLTVQLGNQSCSFDSVRQQGGS